MARVRSLQTLLKATGVTPAAGQSFKTNVVNAASGIHMTDYDLDDWDTWASDLTGATLASGASIHFTFNFVAGVLWRPSLRIASPTGMSAYADIAVDPGTRNATVTGGTWSSTNSGQAVTVQVTGQALHGTYSGGSGTPTLTRNYYKDYTSPDYPLGSADETWEMIINTNAGTYSAPSLTSSTFDIVVQYPLTNPLGSNVFNDVLSHRQTVTVQGYDAGPSASQTFTLEWHGNSSFTNLLQTDTNVSFASYDFTVNSTNSAGDIYVRYRASSTDPWTSLAANPIHYHDVRY